MEMSNTYDLAELAQTLFEEAGDALFLFEPSTEQILDTNPMAQRLTGQTRQQLLRMGVNSLFRSEIQGGMSRLRNAFRKTGYFHSQDGFWLRHAEEGNWLPVNLTITRLHTDPRTLGLITARDMREQRAAREQLRLKEAELNRVLSSVTDCLWSAEVDARGRWSWRYCSPVIEKITGRPVEFFLEKLDNWYQIIHPDDLHQQRESMKRLHEGKPHVEIDFRVLRPEGAVIWVRASTRASLDEDRTLHMDGVLSDITERMNVQEALEHSRRLLFEQFVQLQDFFQNTPVPLVLLDRELSFLHVNGPFSELAGLPVVDIVGRGMNEILPEAIRAAAGRILRQVLEEGEPVINEEMRFGAASNRDETRDWLVSFHPSLLPGGEAVGVYLVFLDITERKQFEERLRESEERFQAFMNNNPSIAFIKDSEGKLVYINGRYETLYQVRKEDVLGKKESEIWPEEFARTFREQDEEVFAGGGAVEVTQRMPLPSGEMRDWLVFKFPFYDRQGTKLLGGLAVDRTDGRKAEEALRRSELRYRLLFERNLAGVFRSTKEGRLLHCNESLVRILGYESREELLAHPVHQLYVNPADRAKLLAHLAENSHISNFVTRLRKRDGDLLWVLLGVNLLTEDDGSEILEGTLVDLSEQKRTEEALRSSEAKYRVLTENLEQSIFLKDSDLRFITANRNFCRGVNCEESALLGKTDFDFYPQQLAEKYRADDLLVLREGRPLLTEEQTLLDGKTCTIRVNKTPVKDGQGKTVGVLGIFWDVTEQTNLENQLRHVQKMDAIGQLAGGIAHDFNNLLTVILGNISFVLSRPTMPEAIDLLRNAEQAGMRAAELTQRLLGFSRQAMLRSEPFDLNHAVEETMRFLKRAIDPRIELKVQRQPDVWTVKADPGQLNQVLMNLSLNARDAMPRGGTLTFSTSHFVPDEAYLRMHVEARPGEYVRLRVQDTGMGMSDAVRQRIFEPFFTTKDVGKGTGLGLATVFSIMKQHHGWIDCQSSEGQGTTFDLYFPRFQEHDAARTPASPAAGSPTRGTETILLVDDEIMIRQLSSMILNRLGYKVLIAEDGHKAIDIYRAQGREIDLIILDGTMPRLSGLDTLREILKMEPEPTVLFSSGFTVEHGELTDFPQIVGFIHKPYRGEELATIIRQTLDAKKR